MRYSIEPKDFGELQNDEIEIPKERYTSPEKRQLLMN